MDLIGKIQKVLSFFIYVVFIGMAIWAVYLAGGIGPILNYTPKGIHGNTLLVLASSVAAIVATWAAPIVSIIDLPKMSRKLSDQAIGQPIGLIITFLLFAIASIAIIVGSEIAFGTPIWNIVDVINRFDSTFAIAGVVLVICLSTISANLVGNLIPAGYQLVSLSQLFNKELHFKTGAIIAAVIALFLFPWKLMENATSIYAFLNFVGAILGPVTGIMMADYYFIRQRQFNLNTLYEPKSDYYFLKGFNVRL
ncbi:cytosine permease [Virgibacillus necropolis]|nr:cytosine permease [Virgibacillus necropolis]